MSDRRLQVFHTVARLLSFTKAAETLEMTQPAVTFQVRQLEEEFNARLFDRSHNKIELTEAGRRVFAYAEQIFGVYQEMQQVVRDVTGQMGGTLRVGASMIMGDYELAQILAHYAQLFPQVACQLKIGSNTEIAMLVEQGCLDVGLVESDFQTKMLDAIPYRTVPYELVVPSDHPWAAEPQIKVSQLADQNLIVGEEGVGGLEYMRAHIPCQTMLQLGSPEAVKCAVEQTRGMAILPPHVFAKEKRLKILKGIPLAPQINTTFCFVLKKQKFPLRILEAFMEFALKGKVLPASETPAEPVSLPVLDTVPEQAPAWAE